MTTNKNTTEVYSPLWLTSNLELPKDRATINAWARSFYAIDSDVRRLIDQHALFLTSVFQIKDCKHKDANRFWKEEMETLNIVSLLNQMIVEYLLLGEVFVYAELAESVGRWSNLFIQNPDYMVVKRTVVANEPIIMLRPDENLRRLCLSKKPEDIEQCNMLNTTIVDGIRNKQNIPLDSFYISHLSHKTSPYEIRGTSILSPLFRELKLPRTPESMATIRAGLYDITMASNKSVAKDVLMQRYILIIEMFEAWLNNKIIKPICKLQRFYTNKNKVKELACPVAKFDIAKLKKSLNAIK